MTTNKITRTVRLGSMALDHLIMGFIIVPPLIIIDLIAGSGEPFKAGPVEKITFMLAMMVYFHKDFVNGKSISKRILGLKIVDRKTGETANELRCFIRNLTIPIWPLEVIISMFSPARRLGDFIANTRVEIDEKENARLIFLDIKKVKFTSVTFWTIMATLACFRLLWFLSERFGI